MSQTAGASARPTAKVGRKRESPRETLYLTRLDLENWRNFTKAGIALQRRVFLVGPNASGKSNLLDGLRFLRDIASVGGGFQFAVQRRGGVSRLRSLAARRYPEIALGLHIGTSARPEVWAYELRFSQNNQRVPVITRERVWRETQVILDRPDADDKRDADRLTQTYLEQINANQSFRDVAVFLASIRYQHIVPQLVREPDRTTGRVDDPFGSDFLEQLAKVPERTRQARLRRIRDALRAAVPKLGDLEFWRDELCREVGLDIKDSYAKGGKRALLERLSGYNNAARFSPWIIVVDLGPRRRLRPNVPEGSIAAASAEHGIPNRRASGRGLVSCRRKEHLLVLEDQTIACSSRSRGRAEPEADAGESRAALAITRYSGRHCAPRKLWQTGGSCLHVAHHRIHRTLLGSSSGRQRI